MIVVKKNKIRIKFQASNHILPLKREETGKTEEEMSEMVGVHRMIWGCAERMEKDKMSKQIINKICKFLEMDIDDVFPEWSSDFSTMINSGKKYMVVDDQMARSLLSDNNPDQNLLQ